MATSYKSQLNRSLSAVQKSAGVRSTATILSTALDGHDSLIAAIQSAQTTDEGNITTLQTNAWDGISKVSGSNFTTTSLTLVDITGLTFTTLANKIYEFEFNIYGTSGEAVNGSKFALNHTGAGAQVVSTGIVLTAASAALGSFTALATASGATWLSAGLCQISLKGFLLTGANAGTFSVQVEKVTSGTLTAYLGSILKWKLVA